MTCFLGFDLSIFFLEEMRKTNVPSFIDKTWLMLEEENYEHALRWLPHGGSFEIVDETAFANDVLPHFFKHSNFSSFVRQVLALLSSSICITSTNAKRRRVQFSSTINSFAGNRSILKVNVGNY